LVIFFSYITFNKFSNLAELQKQTLNIVVTMDAFGNPLGLVSDFKESFQGLLFEGDLGGFVSGIGYGVTNSFSKVGDHQKFGKIIIFF
jgi:hypothetical protein